MLLATNIQKKILSSMSGQKEVEGFKGIAGNVHVSARANISEEKRGSEMKITALPPKGTKVFASIEADHFILNDSTHTGHDESNLDDPNEVSGLAVALGIVLLKEFGIAVAINSLE